MKHTLALLTVLLLAPLAVAPASPVAPAAQFRNLTPETCRADFVCTLDVMRKKFFAKDDAFIDDSGNHIHVASLAAACEMRAWQWTHEERYAKSALARMRLIASKGAEIREVGFFTPLPLTFAFRAASEAKLVDADLSAAMEKFAAQRFRPRDSASLNNQTMTRACGLELAAQVWPALPETEKWHDYATTIATLLGKIEDIPENTPGYNALDVVCVWLLTDLLKTPDVAAKPGIAAMYRRYRDQVSPAGFIPPYGDSGSAPRPFTVDWPMDSAWAHYVAGFERAAREYHDPTMRWAAARVARAGSQHMPLGGGYTDMEPLFYSSFTAEWMDVELAPQQPRPGSQVLTRRDETSTDALDKLILAPSREPGAPFAMVDLYCRGAHGHVNQHGALTYFEFRDTPLLTAMGYNSREPAEANLLLMASSNETFPHNPDGFTPGVWQEANLPTSRLPPPDPSQPFLRRIDALNFRITAGRKGVVFTAADLRLSGGKKAAVSLDDLHSTVGWSGKPVSGGDGLEWNVPGGVHFLEKKRFNTVFDCREHPLLTFRWKLSNNDEQARPVILRVQCGGAPIDYHAQAVQLDPTLLGAIIEERDGQQRGTLRYGGWFTPDTTLCREVTLTKSGVLVVRDTIVPGDSARGMVAGPVWHMASTNAPTAKANWFNSAGGRMELLTWFAPAPERTFGTQSVNVWSKDNQQTVFARQPLQPGKAVVFISVLMPHERGTDAAKLAAQVSVQNPAGNRIRVTTGHDSATVEFIASGSTL